MYIMGVNMAKGLPMDIQETFNTDKTRALLGKRLGEVIEGVIGDARVRQMFDHAGKHPDEYAGKPTGLAALDLGVITPATKNALLIAQAAVRTLDAADRAEQTLRGGKTPAARSFDDDVFKFVGSPNDPEALQRAQATWQIAEYYHAEVTPAPLSYAYRHRKQYEWKNNVSESVETLRASARASLSEASDMLHQEGHVKASNDIGAIAYGLRVKDYAVSPRGPGVVLGNSIGLANDEARRAADVSYSGQFWEVPKEILERFDRLSALAAPPEKPKPGIAAPHPLAP